MRIRSVFCVARFVGGLPKGRLAVFIALCACVLSEVNAAETVSIDPHTFTIQEGYEIVQVAARHW